MKPHHSVLFALFLATAAWSGCGGGSESAAPDDRAADVSPADGEDVGWVYRKSKWVQAIDQLVPQNNVNIGPCMYQLSAPSRNDIANRKKLNINQNGFDRFTLADLSHFSSAQVYINADFRPVFCLNGNQYQTCAFVREANDAGPMLRVDWDQHSRYIGYLYLPWDYQDWGWQHATSAILTSEDSYLAGAAKQVQQPEYDIGIALFTKPPGSAGCPADPTAP
jgi:hypothetical protein